MTLLLGLQYREQLDPGIVTNLDEMAAALQAAFTAQTQGQTMNLLLGLQSPEQLPPIVRDELDQAFAAIQTAFNTQSHNIIKLIQSGTITMSTGTASATASLSPSVNVNNAALHLLGEAANSTDPDNASMQIALTNSTTVTAIRGQSNDNGGTVGFRVTEYQPGVLRSAIQRGTISLPDGTNSADAIITSVDSARSELENLGVKSQNAGVGGEPATNVRLAFVTSGGSTASTIVRATRTSGKNVTVGYEVREFY